MALLKFENIGITALAAAVPKNTVDNYTFGTAMGVTNMDDVVAKIGVKERRRADEATCSSDLCFAAAERLIADNNIDRSEIDLLVFISQTPDYRMPATSVTLQHRLGLPEQTMAFDINLGCSAFVYGLSVVYSLMQQPGIRKALLLDGETRTKAYSQKDRKTAFLFGDGGVAALIERNEKFGPSYFSLNSDGSRQDLIKTPAGGYRMPSSPETVVERVMDEDGNIRSLEHGQMNGPDVFNFVIREIPKDIRRIYEHSQTEKEQIDYFVFHQANSYINGYLMKKLKLEPAKVPMSIEHFGNTSSVSIPLTITSQLAGKLTGRKKLLMAGFGVGLSWATAVLDVVDCNVSELEEI
jgi:3-oxoacyl-[acyl-carrier-protein] synthase-3